LARKKSSHPSASGDYRWRKLAAKFRDYCHRRNALCWLCVQRGDYEHAAIDYGAPPLSPKAFEPDHIKPWETHPQLFYVWANLAPSHSRCNRQRQHQMMDAPTTLNVVEAWVKPDW
jgi:hypothetical protein